MSHNLSMTAQLLHFIVNALFRCRDLKTSLRQAAIQSSRYSKECKRDHSKISTFQLISNIFNSWYCSFSWSRPIPSFRTPPPVKGGRNLRFVSKIQSDCRENHDLWIPLDRSEKRKDPALGSKAFQHTWWYPCKKEDSQNLVRTNHYASDSLLK